jgi:hypothetical protein
MANNQPLRSGVSYFGIAFRAFLFLLIVLCIAAALFGWWQFLFR